MAFKIIFGDIHGCPKATKKAIEIAEYKNIQTIFLGDYIDRGPDSVTTIDEIIKISEDGNYCGA
jgi:predicted phosphodiesterase